MNPCRRNTSSTNPLSVGLASLLAYRTLTEPLLRRRP